MSKFDTQAQGGGGGGGAENQRPVADAGADQTAASPTRVYLDGRASTDGGGQIVAYQWRQVSIWQKPLFVPVKSYSQPRL